MTVRKRPGAGAEIHSALPIHDELQRVQFRFGAMDFRSVPVIFTELEFNGEAWCPHGIIWKWETSAPRKSVYSAVNRQKTKIWNIRFPDGYSH